MPYMFCNIHEVCTYASRTATSYWLATEEQIPQAPVVDQTILKHIGNLTIFLLICAAYIISHAFQKNSQSNGIG